MKSRAIMHNKENDNNMSYAIGLISGTSLDGCDAALVSIEEGQVRPVEFVTLPMEEALRRHGLLAIATANTVIRFAPPLIITESDVRRALRIVKKACADITATPG